MPLIAKAFAKRQAPTKRQRSRSPSAADGLQIHAPMQAQWTSIELPNSGISEIAVNASLAFIQGAEPGMSPSGGPAPHALSAAARLLRACAA